LETEQKYEADYGELETNNNNVWGNVSDVQVLKGSEILRNAAFFKDQQIKRLQKIINQNRLVIFMQEKLAEMKSKFMTQVCIRVKPIAETAELDEDNLAPESFSILNTTEMGLAK